MNHVYLLDCTLRDGGYVNDWRFGREAIEKIKEGLEGAGIDIIELGFFRNGPSDPDRSVYSSGRDIHRVMARKKAGVLYSAMLDGADLDRLYPVEQLGSPEVSGIDYIRVCTWKRLMKEHLRYCQKIVGGGIEFRFNPPRWSSMTRLSL